MSLVKIPFFTLAFCFLSFGIYSQQSFSDTEKSHEAFEAFQQEQYKSVIDEYQSNNSLNQEDEEILYLISKLRSGEDVSKEIESWIRQNKNDPLITLANFYQGQFHFYQGDSVVSRNYLKRVRHQELSEKDRALYGFIYGVLQLHNKNYRNAIKLFAIAKVNGFDNQTELSYYQGFTSFHLGQKEEAFQAFSNAQNDPNLGRSSKFFMAKIKLEEGKYEEVIAIAKGELSENKSVVNAGFYQLVGEAYALQNNLAKADAYFDEALRVHPGRPSAALYYQAGVSKFKLGSQEKALEYLTESGTASGLYAQLSAFQLGRLHSKRAEYEKALTAYKEATSADDEKIKEESTYQTANLSAMLERFTEAITYATDYLEKFANGQFNQQMEELIAEMYLRTSNYEMAISHLEQLGIRGARQQEAYQKVTFQNGLLSFNDGSFDDARTWFNKSLKFPLQGKLKDEAHYYLAEIFMQNGAYSRAIQEYQNQSSLDTRSYYGIGYAHFNLRSYQKAIPFFRSVADSKTASFQQDATLRLADCFYATKTYESALETYEKVPNSDYTSFHKGLILKSMGKIQQARISLSLVSSDSPWKDDAIYKKALLEFEIAAFELAEQGFTSLIVRFPQSEFIPKSYLNRAIAKGNRQNWKSALEDYQYVLDNHMKSDAAFSAILGLQELKQKGVLSEDLDIYIAAYKQSNPQNESLELVEFENAKSHYFDLSYAEAIPKLSDFINDYPESRFRSEAHYYLGDALFRTQQLEQSAETFEKQKFLRSPFTGRVLHRLGSIYYVLENYNEAIESYQMLLELNLSAKDNFIAWEGLMESYYASNSYLPAIQEVKNVLQSDWKSPNADRKAFYINALAKLALSDSSARSALVLAANGTDKYAAETSFLIGQLLFEEANYEEAIDHLFNHIETFGSYVQWVEKAYLLIADVYIARSELFQAKATLRSIIQHGKYEELRKEAQNRLNEIEKVSTPDTTQIEDQ